MRGRDNHTSWRKIQRSRPTDPTDNPKACATAARGNSPASNSLAGSARHHPASRNVLPSMSKRARSTAPCFRPCLLPNSSMVRSQRSQILSSHQAAWSSCQSSPSIDLRRLTVVEPSGRSTPRSGYLRPCKYSSNAAVQITVFPCLVGILGRPNKISNPCAVGRASEIRHRSPQTSNTMVTSDFEAEPSARALVGAGGLNLARSPASAYRLDYLVPSPVLA